jgi:sugar lactone lactonase YvrE
MRYQRLAVLLLLCGSVAAQTTKTWEQSRFEDFEKGTSKGVAITSEGSLQLAPDLKSLVSTPSTYLWSAVSDSKGNLFTAGGSPARVYRVTTDGKITSVFNADELQVQALAIDKDGTVFAATNPDGKVYKISPVVAVKGKKAEATAPALTQAAPASTPNQPADTKAAEKKPAENSVANDPGYTSTLFYDPKQKYIWALALDDTGRLYVATGDHGEIHRVEKTGIGSVFFDSDEAHIRSLAFKGTELIAGSDGSGLVYRINPDGKGFVLYSAPKKEITAIAVRPDGTLYVAAAGDKKSTGGAATPLSPAPATSGGASHTVGAVPTQPSPAVPQNIPLTGLGASGSEIYRIAGAPTRIWSSRDDLVYALTIDHNGRLLAGTGNKGKIYQIFDNGEFVDLQKATANQVIAFAPTNYGDLFAVTSNLGKVFLLQDATQREGTFDSDVFDARLYSRWGRVEARTTGNTELWARSGNVDNPDRNWSDWQKIDIAKDAPIAAPSSRFMQWRAVLHSGLPAATLEYVRVNFLQENVAPIVDDVSVQVGQKFGIGPRTVAETIAANASKASGMFQPPQTTISDRDYIAIRWNAHDENDDLLGYTVYYRGDGETRWQVLKDDIADRFYSFESNLLPDGGYTVMVIANDAPAHSPGLGLRSVGRQSSRFEVDNTPPAISNLTGTVEDGKLHIRFNAADSMSIIKRAEFSVDAGDWSFLAPKGEIADSKNETYEFFADLPSFNEQTSAGTSDEHVVSLRVYDRADNMASAKVVVKAPPTPPPAAKKK